MKIPIWFILLTLFCGGYVYLVMFYPEHGLEPYQEILSYIMAGTTFLMGVVTLIETKKRKDT